jgi:alpha-N-arabinofuranosidase
MPSPTLRIAHRSVRLLQLVAAIAVVAGCGLPVARAADVELTVAVDKPGHRISPRLYGIFFEDINFGGDGGLSAELVKNGGFEFPESMMGWGEVREQAGAGSLRVLNDMPRAAANSNYLRIETSEPRGGYGAVNEGFRGVGVRQGENYEFSAWVRTTAGANQQLQVRLVGQNNRPLADATIAVRGSDWKLVTAKLTPAATEAHGTLEILARRRGQLDVDGASLYPEHTWKDRPQGLRADLVQKLADLKPAFFRFPGGCIVEGSQLKHRYQWKTTIGDLADRRLIVNRWNTEFRHRLTPDYYQTFAVGFFEYFQLCEDIGAEPLPILNCGMACQFNSSELVPMDELGPYIQDAIDLIEFANGPATSPWGARRAAMGHPEPFNMKLLGVGNEQWGPQYIERYAAFAKVLKEKHPEIELVSGAGPSPGDDRFNYLWPELRKLKADIVDEHSYAMPDWFRAAATRYDEYERNGPKVFMGEYAAQTVAIVSPDNRNTLGGALGEAAFMTGLERNSDVVVMSSYAPLFGHEEAWQWRPNLIWFDNLTTYATPNYYVQQLFALNRGDVMLPVELADNRGAEPAAGRVGVATFETAAEFKDVSVKRGDEELLAGGLGGTTRTSFGGRWSEADGVVAQTDARGTGRSVFGDTSWSDYTLRLKARKTAGREGFMVIFRNGYGGSLLQWNLGGWGNSQHGLQRNDAGVESIVEQKPGSIEENRWYDVRIELAGNRVRCYLDDEVVHDLEIAAPELPRLFATASRMDDGAVIVKVVNTTGAAAETQVRLAGLNNAERGEVTVLAGGPWDENTIEQPERVKPETRALDGVGGEFTHTFPAHSLTVLRVE